MKEVSYNNVLGKDIETSKIKCSFWKDFLRFLVSGLGLLVVIFGFSKLIEIGLLAILSFVGGFATLSAILIGVVTRKNKDKKTSATESLASLKNDLQLDGINLSMANMQKAIVTEHKRELKETNRKGEVSNVEEIIKRYYMLDEQQQIQVLQQTLTKYRSETTNRDTMQLQLLEDEDLKNIELPETIITKRLQFNDTKK